MSTNTPLLLCVETGCVELKPEFINFTASQNVFTKSDLDEIILDFYNGITSMHT